MPPLPAFAFVLMVFVRNVAVQDPSAHHAAIPTGRISFNDWQCGATAAERILACDSARSVCGDYMRECYIDLEKSRLSEKGLPRRIYQHRLPIKVYVYARGYHSSS